MGYEGIGVVGGIVLFIAGLVAVFAGASMPSPRKIDKQFVRLKNVCPAFLDDLPPPPLGPALSPADGYPEL